MTPEQQHPTPDEMKEVEGHLEAKGLRHEEALYDEGRVKETREVEAATGKTKWKGQEKVDAEGKLVSKQQTTVEHEEKTEEQNVRGDGTITRSTEIAEEQTYGPDGEVQKEEQHKIEELHHALYGVDLEFVSGVGPKLDGKANVTLTRRGTTRNKEGERLSSWLQLEMDAAECKDFFAEYFEEVDPPTGDDSVVLKPKGVAQGYKIKVGDEVIDLTLNKITAVFRGGKMKYATFHHYSWEPQEKEQ